MILSAVDIAKHSCC